jgi:MFS transporter, ENTS family, enterobactin (siderophore) exporter
MGIVAALQTLPDLLLGLPAGALADRWDRRRMMLYADGGRALLTALIPLSVALQLQTMIVILIVVFPINALRVVFMAAWTGAVPNLVGRRLIGPATSYFEAIFALGFIVGPGLAGVLASRIGPGPTLAIDAGSFLVSAAALWFIRTPLRATAGPRSESHILAEIRDGIRFVLGNRTLRAAVAFWASVGIGTAGLIPTLTYFMTRDLGLGADFLGLVIGAYSLGSLAGGLMAARLTHGFLGPLLLGGNALTGLLLIALSTTHNPGLMAGLSLVAGIANTLVLVSYVTIRASSTPDELLGRGAPRRAWSRLGCSPLVRPSPGCCSMPSPAARRCV